MKRPFPSMLMAAAALAGFATALPAAAQFAKPEDAIKYRKANMTLMATHFGRVAGMANGRIPFDAKLAADNAEMAAAVTKWQFTGFVEGSDKGDTKADPKIWTEKDKFNAAGATLQEAVSKLNVAAKSGNLDAIKAAVGDTGKACKGCHDTYQKQ
jgi:cytochrome c556